MNKHQEMPTVIKVEDLSKVYKLYDKPTDRLKESIHPLRKKYHKEFYALKDVSFEVKKGEILGIIGKNGSGKSTLLKIITGVLTQTTGNINVNGKISALLELGAGFNPEYTGIENIYLSGMIIGYSKAEINERLEDILNFADIGEFIYQPVKTYSSGMFVRLAFAVAINVEPEILIIDEAISVGDVRFQQKCYSKFDSFRNSGKTILFVSHSLEIIKRYCTRAILINDGKIIQQGIPKDVVNNYLRMLRNLDLESSSYDRKPKHLYNKIKSRTDSLFKVEESIWYNKNEYKYGTNEAVFTRVGIFNDYGNIETEFEVGSDIIIIVEFMANESIDELYFGFGFRDIHGQDLFVFNGTPEYDNYWIKDIEKGKLYKIRIKQKILLNPNDYTISFSLSKIINSEILILQIRYDVLFYKVVGSGRHYTGLFYMDTDIEILE